MTQQSFPNMMENKNYTIMPNPVQMINQLPSNHLGLSDNMIVE
jgi:hypothetical protein